MDDFPSGAAIVFGATGGIGRVVCLELAQAGSDIAIIWRSKKETAQQLATQIHAMGCKVTLHQCDVLEEGAVGNSIKQAVTEHGRLHTLVWGAGPLVEQVYVADTKDAQWRNAVNVEVHGFFSGSSSRNSSYARAGRIYYSSRVSR